MRRLGTNAVAVLLVVWIPGASCNHEADSGDARDADCLLECDAVYLPWVTFTFTDDGTGEAYCGSASVSYEVIELHPCGGSGYPSETTCECQDGVMVVASGWYSGLGMQCHINPQQGATVRVIVEAPGYESFQTEFTLPYVCEPMRTVEVRLVPAAP